MIVYVKVKEVLERVIPVECEPDTDKDMILKGINDKIDKCEIVLDADDFAERKVYIVKDGINDKSTTRQLNNREFPLGILN